MILTFTDRRMVVMAGDVISCESRVYCAYMYSTEVRRQYSTSRYVFLHLKKHTAYIENILANCST